MEKHQTTSFHTVGNINPRVAILKRRGGHTGGREGWKNQPSGTMILVKTCGNEVSKAEKL